MRGHPIMYQNHEPFHLVSIEPFHLLDGHSTIPTLQFDNREQLWSVHQEGENIGYMIFDESLLKGKLFVINCLFLSTAIQRVHPQIPLLVLLIG